jgi:large conductance mechanosensitive channel protein
MAGLGPAVHVFTASRKQDVDARDKRGHDDREFGVQERCMFEEFKKFALRGNAVDLAIGVIIGAAFGAIVNSLVGDILSPIIGAVAGGFDFSNYFIALSSKVTADSLVEAKKQGAILAWGNFVTIVIKLMNRMLQSEPAKAPALRSRRCCSRKFAICSSASKMIALAQDDTSSGMLRFMGNPMRSSAFFSYEMISGIYSPVLRGHFF